jgi:hypothetical protein
MANVRKRQSDNWKQNSSGVPLQGPTEPLLLIHFLNGRKTLSGFDRAESEELNASARERILVLLSGFRDILLDLAGQLPASYPREGPLALTLERVFSRIEAERTEKPITANWPRTMSPDRPNDTEGEATCWGNVNALLADYPLIRQARLVPVPPRKKIATENLVTADVHIGWAIEEANIGTRPSLEARMAKEIIQLAQAGTISRLRRCCCGIWFYAHRAQQTAHLAKCRQKKYSKLEETKARRRLYMRWRYAMLESPNSPRRKIPFAQWSRKFQ